MLALGEDWSEPHLAHYLSVCTFHTPTHTYIHTHTHTHTHTQLMEAYKKLEKQNGEIQVSTK